MRAQDGSLYPKYALFAVDSIQFSYPFVANGVVGSRTNISPDLSSSDSLSIDSSANHFLEQELIARKGALNLLTNYQNLPNLLRDTILSPGQYRIFGNALIKGLLKLDDSSGQYLFTIDGNLEFDSAFVFWPEEGITNIIWNVNGSVTIGTPSTFVGEFLTSGDFTLIHSQYVEAAIFSLGKIKIQDSLSGAFRKPVKLFSVPCATGFVSYGDMIVDGGFEETIVDQNNCPTDAGISSISHIGCQFGNAVETQNWTCCRPEINNHIGPNVIEPFQKGIPGITLAPSNNGLDLSNDPNSTCNYMAELWTSFAPSNGSPIYKTTLVQNLQRSIRTGRFRISGFIRFGHGGYSGAATTIQVLGGFGESQNNEGGGCYIDNDAADHNRPEFYLNRSYPFLPDPFNPINFNQWRYFCEDIVVTEDDRTCFLDRFSISIFSLINTWTIGAILDNVRIVELDVDTRSKIDNFCFGQPTSINLNTSSLVHLHSTVPPNGNWFLMPGNIPIANGVFTPPSAGKYTIVYRAVENGCPFYENISFEVFLMPTANAGPNLEVCLSDGLIELNGTTPADGVWSPGAGIVVQDGFYYLDPSAVPLTYATGANPFTYNLTLTKVIGACSAADQLQITYHGAIGTLGGNFATCENEPITLQFQGIAAPGSFFNWSVQYDGDPGLNPSYTVSPAFILNDVPNAQGLYTTYQFTPLGSGTYTITLTISDPNAPRLSYCLLEIRNLTITVFPISSSGVCCAKGYFVNEPNDPITGQTVVVNDGAAPGTQIRATIGDPNHVSTIVCPDDETMIFDGEYHILGPIRLIGGVFSNFIIRPNTILFFDGEEQGYDIGFMEGCYANHPKIKRPFLYLEPGTKLTLRGATLSANCDEMWQGIIVPQGATLDCDEGPNGETNRVEHAIVGVLSTNNCNSFLNWNNSFLQIRRTDFANCMIGVEDYNRTDGSETKEINYCTFRSNPNRMLHPFALNEVQGMQSPDPDDRYFGLAGVWLAKPNPGKTTVSPRILNSKFQGLIFGVWTQGQRTSISGCDFSYCYRAAVAQTNSTGTQLIGNNYDGNISISNSQIRIPAEAVQTFSEKGYELVGLPSNAWRLTPSTSVYGIKVYNSNLTVSGPSQGLNNYFITGDPNRATIKKAYGVWSRPYPAEAVTIENMYFHNLDEAIGIRRFAFNGTPINPGTIRGNLIVDNKVGVSQFTSNNSSAFTEQVPLQILQNNFSGNQTAISLDASGTSSATDLTLKCNRFDIDNSNYAPPFYGLVLGENHRLRYNAIGGNFLSGTGDKSPGANIWPLAGTTNRAIRPCGQDDVEEACTDPSHTWFSPNQWLSIKNNSSQPVKMYRYLNEYVGAINSQVEKIVYSKRCYTSANDLSTVQLGNDILECSEGIPNPTVVVFPTRMAVDSINSTTSAFLASIRKGKNELGQNIPNPGNTEVLIPYRLAENSGSARLEIIQLETGRTIRQISLSKEATGLKLDINQFSTGVYAYTLHVDGSPVQTRKLVVVR